MLLDTINRKLAEQYARETRARTVLRLVPTRKTPEKSAMHSTRPAARAATPPPKPLDVQAEPDVRLPAPAPLPVMPETLPAPAELPEPEKPETDKASKGTVKPGCITVGLPLPKEMHAIFKARALATGTSIKHQVLLSLVRDLG